jgi:hypothetical protein
MDIRIVPWMFFFLLLPEAILKKYRSQGRATKTRGARRLRSGGKAFPIAQRNGKAASAAQTGSKSTFRPTAPRQKELKESSNIPDPKSLLKSHMFTL